MKKAFFILHLLFIFAAFSLFSQEIEIEAEENSEAQIRSAVSDDDRLFVIAVFDFDIKGRTLPFAVIYRAELKIGETFSGRESLDKYIRDKNQVLINQRVLKDNASITYSIGGQSEDGSYPVTLFIKVEDTWNIIALPRPAFSTSSGIDITIKARDYNFLGTMNPLRIDLGYRYDEEKRNSFQFEVYSDTPFRAAGLTWNLRFDNLFSYRPQVSEPFFFQNVTGLSVEMPLRNTILTLGAEENFILNQENSDRQKQIYNKELQDGLYMNSELFASWKIPTGVFVSRYGELTYTPRLSFSFNHELPDWPLLPFRTGPFMNFRHSFGFERIDWHANFRDGLSVFLSNSYSLDFYRMENELNPLSSSISISAAGYFILGEIFGFSSRFEYRHWFYNDPDYNYNERAGDNLRGVSDKSVCADFMFSLNADFPLRIFLFMPSQWFNNKKLSFFDFEFQAAPIIDMAFFHDPRTDEPLGYKNTVFTVGLDFIFFPFFMRNLYIRLGYACNLKELLAYKKLPSGDNREIYLLMGHFY